MFARIFCALALAAAISLPSPTRADDGNLLVYYGCDTHHSRLVVKTYIADKKPWQIKSDNLHFLSLYDLGMPLECSFRSGDQILVKSYYGDDFAYGGYQHVMIIVNGQRIEKLLDFNSGHTDSYKITAPSAVFKQHPRQVTDPLEDFASQLPPGYIDFNGMSETDRHKLLVELRNINARYSVK